MKKLIGFLASAALVTSGAVLANEGQFSKDQQNQSTSSQSSSSSSSKDQPDNMGSPTGRGPLGQGMGGTGQAGSSTPSASTSTASEAGQQQLTGEFVKADRKTIYIDHMGAIVPLKVDKNTQFQGGVKRASELKQGQQVRASFTVKNQTENLATSIQLTDQGTGGAGSFDENRGSLNPGSSGSMDQNPPVGGSPGNMGQPGTGGSGDEDQGTVDQPGQTGSQSGSSSSGSSSGPPGY